AIVDGVPLHGAPGDGAKASLMLRPERIGLTSGAGGGQLTAKVRDITFLGNNIQVLVEPYGIGPISVRLPFGHAAVAGLAPGAMVSLSIDPSTAHAF
uniref:TOBE domain-containing protein n=1 Tax=Shinella sp. BYT-45 TaxID=3377377 RepID=UPI0039814C52